MTKYPSMERFVYIIEMQVFIDCYLTISIIQLTLTVTFLRYRE